MKSSSFVHLRQDGVSLLVDLAPELVRIIHWGEDLGDTEDFEGYLAATIEPTAHAEGDSPDQSGIWREQARGSIGSPVLKGHRNGKDFSPLLVPTSHTGAMRLCLQVFCGSNLIPTEVRGDQYSMLL